MNTLKKNLLIVAITVIATTSVLGLFAFKNKLPEGGTQIAHVSAIFNGWIVVNIRQEDPEYIETKSVKYFDKASYADMNAKLNAVFSKLYSEEFRRSH